MNRRELFRTDGSERDALKANISYIKIKNGTPARPEIGIIVALLNIPSEFLYRREGRGALDRLLDVLREHSGFGFDVPSQHIHSKTFAVESTYTIENRVDGTERTWTGSWNSR